MSDIDKPGLIKELSKIEAKKELDSALDNTFVDTYGCTRVWSAWSYNTMSQEDFVAYQSGDEAFDEMRDKLEFTLKTNRFNNVEELVEFFYDTGHDLYFNDDIESNFNSDHFNSDYLDHIDLNPLFESIKKYQDILLPIYKNEEVLNNKTFKKHNLKPN